MQSPPNLFYKRVFTVRNLFLQNLLAVDDDDSLIVVVNTLTGDVVGCTIAVSAFGIDLVDCRWLYALELYLVDIAVSTDDGDADDSLALLEFLRCCIAN